MTLGHNYFNKFVIPKVIIPHDFLNLKLYNMNFHEFTISSDDDLVQ